MIRNLYFLPPAACAVALAVTLIAYSLKARFPTERSDKGESRFQSNLLPFGVLTVMATILLSGMNRFAEYESISTYESRLADSDVRSSFEKSVNEVHLGSQDGVQAILNSYHYSWIITKDLVIGLTEYSLKDFQGTFSTRTVGSRPSLTPSYYFVADEHDRELRYVREGVAQNETKSVRIVKLSLYPEQVCEGNDAFMNVARSRLAAPKEFSFDISIDKMRISTTPPILHELVTRPTLWKASITDVLMIPHPMVKLDEMANTAASLWKQVGDALAKTDLAQERKDLEKKKAENNANVEKLIAFLSHPSAGSDSQGFESFTVSYPGMNKAKTLSLLYYLQKLPEHD